MRDVDRHNVGLWRCIVRLLVSRMLRSGQCGSAGGGSIDARKTRRDQGRKSEIRIQIRTANAALNADGVRAFAVKAETDRPIVLAPCDLGRRERTDLESPVGVDVGRQKEGDVLRIFLQAPKVMVH